MNVVLFKPEQTVALPVIEPPTAGVTTVKFADLLVVGVVAFPAITGRVVAVVPIDILYVVPGVVPEGIVIVVVIANTSPFAAVAGNTGIDDGFVNVVNVVPGNTPAEVLKKGAKTVALSNLFPFPLELEAVKVTVTVLPAQTDVGLTVTLVMVCAFEELIQNKIKNRLSRNLILFIHFNNFIIYDLSDFLFIGSKLQLLLHLFIVFDV